MVLHRRSSGERGEVEGMVEGMERGWWKKVVLGGGGRDGGGDGRGDVGIGDGRCRGRNKTKKASLRGTKQSFCLCHGERSRTICSCTTVQILRLRYQ